MATKPFSDLGEIESDQSTSKDAAAAAEQENKPKTLAQLFFIFSSVFSVLAMVLAFGGFLVPAWENETPLSMFYMVFGVFQQSVTTDSPSMSETTKQLFGIVSLLYLGLSVVHWILKGCDLVGAAALVQFVAGLMMEFSVFAYACMQDSSDAKVALFLEFSSGICSTFGAVCSWASKYDGVKKNKVLAKYLKAWNENWDPVTIVFLLITFILMIVTMSIPGWNTEPTTVWKVESQHGSTFVFSGMVVVSFTGTGVAILVPLIRYCIEFENDNPQITIEEGQNQSNESRNSNDEADSKNVDIGFKLSESLTKLYRIFAFISGVIYLFALSAFTSDIHDGMDNGSLQAGLALSFGWVTAIFYALALCPQFVLILSEALSTEKDKFNLLRYLAYTLEFVLLVAVVFVPIDSVSMLFALFGSKQCDHSSNQSTTVAPTTLSKFDNSSSGNYTEDDAFNEKMVIASAGNAFLIARVILIFVGSTRKNSSCGGNDLIFILSSYCKAGLAIFLFIMTIVCWSIVDMVITDITMLLVCLMSASFALFMGSIAELRYKEHKCVMDFCKLLRKGFNLTYGKLKGKIKVKASNNNKKSILDTLTSKVKKLKDEIHSIIKCIKTKANKGTLADKTFYYMRELDKEIDGAAIAFLLVGFCLEVSAICIPGWNINDPTTVYHIEKHCQSLQAFSILVMSVSLPSFGFAAVLTIFLFWGRSRYKDSPEDENSWTKNVCRGVKVSLFWGGFIFSFSTLAISSDVNDDDSWSKDTPYMLSVAASCVYIFGFVVTFLMVAFFFKTEKDNDQTNC